MLNDDQLKDLTYLELHEKVEEMLRTENFDPEKMVEWFLSTPYLTENDVIEHIIIPFLQNGMYSTNVLKKMLSFEFGKGGKNE